MFCIRSKRCCVARYIFHEGTGNAQFLWFRRMNTDMNTAVKLCNSCSLLRLRAFLSELHHGDSDEDSDEDSEEDSEEDNDEDNDEDSG